MDYQTTQGMPGSEPSKKGLYAIIAIIVIIGGLIYWYSSSTSQTGSQSSAVDQTQSPALSGSNTTSAIQNDLSTTPDPSAALNSDKNTVSAGIKAL